MKLNKKQIAFFGIMTAVILYLTLKDDFLNIITYIVKVNINWLMVAIIGMFMYWALEAKTLHLMIKEFDSSIKYRSVLKIVLNTQFFNGITPFASGGQPFQIYMMTQYGLPISSATSASLQNFITYQTVLVAFGVFAIIVEYVFHILRVDLVLLKSLTILGFSLNAGVIVTLYAVTLFPRINHFVSHTLIDFLHRIKIIKDVDHQREKFSKIVHDFHNNAKLLRNNMKIFVFGLFFNILKLTILYSIPFIVALSLGIDQLNLFDTIIACAYVMLISAFIPLPGGSGGAEVSFLSFFGSFIVGAQVTAIMVVWRFTTYYFGLLVGFVTVTLFNRSAKEYKL